MKKTNFKKTLSAVLALVFVLSTLAMIPLTTSAETDPAPLVPPTISGITGAGTESDPYLIPDAAALLKLINASMVKNAETGKEVENSTPAIAAGTEVYVNITASFSLPNRVDGEKYYPYSFNGMNAYGGDNAGKICWRIDGGNYTISNLQEPLFGGLSKTEKGITIKNLKLDGNVVSTGCRYVGALVGGVYGNVTIENCHFSGTIKGTYAREAISIGGLVGLVSKFNFTMKDCTNSGSILNDCVTGTSKTEAWSGGLIGQLSHYADSGEHVQVVENCTNTGAITLNNATAVEKSGVGGIVGGISVSSIYKDLHYYAFIKDCTNSGTLTSNQENSWIGGICGVTQTQYTYHGENASTDTEFINCTTTGNYPIYHRNNIMNVHSYAVEGDCECIDEGCYYTRHTYDNSWDATCNVDGCGHTRNFPVADTATYAWYTANGGTESAPYEIATANDLAGLSAMSYGLHGAARVDFDGKYFKLTDNINMNGLTVAPINAENATIVFDGNGKTISNWLGENVEHGGLFAYVGALSEIKDLTLDNVDFTAVGVSGLVVAQAKAGLIVNNVVITDTCSLTTPSGDIAGGVVGAIVDLEATSDDENTVMITFCVNNADVSAKIVAGGIVGKIQGNYNYQISHCINKGDLKATSIRNDNLYVGGMLGWAAPGNTKDGNGTAIEGYADTAIKSCYNVGKLSTVDTTSSCYVGGIAGYLDSVEGAEMTIANCYDNSARQVSTKSEGTKLANAGLVGGADKRLTRWMDTCYATNADGTAHPFTAVVAWSLKVTSSQVDKYSKLVPNVTAEIINGNGAKSTIQAEMARIDEAVATKTLLVWNFVEPEDDGDGDDDGSTNNTQNSTDNTQDTTAAADTTAATEDAKSKGCKKSIDSTYAVIALISVLGFAFVAKKKEEN